MHKQVYRTGVAIAVALMLGGVALCSLAQDPGQNAGGFNGQQAGRAPGQARITGSISGTVFFGDTQRPARFANVQIIPVSTDSEGRVRGGGPSGRTSLDGTFLIDNVEVGDYYVTASATGYISPYAEAQVAIGNGTPQDEALRRLPVAHVAQGAPGSASITLDRGAVIAGSVSWDDGSPAAGVQVSTVAATTSSNQGAGRGFGGFGGPFGGRFPGSTADTTDDRGRFRLTGVAPGEYLVRASVQAPVGAMGNGSRGGFGRTIPLSAFAPGKIRRSEAQTIRVAGADERNDVAITLDLRALHTVSGQVSVASGSAVSGGQVRLVDATDSSLARFAEIASDGSFHVPYVPAGTYTMSVNARVGGSGNPGQGGTFNPGQNLQPLQQTLAVADGDLSGINVTLTPAVTAATR